MLSPSSIDKRFQLQVNDIPLPVVRTENLKWGPYDAITTESVELKQMVLDLEASFLRQLLLHLDKATTGEIYYFATSGAN
jgi:hypothetical protein